jgi:membrane protein DedA with SNARE-associated domain
MIELASILTVATNIGYPLIFLIVVIETGCGVPVAPGEIAVVTGGIAASAGRLDIVLVIAVAAAAAIIGDNIGYAIGRRGGRWILERPGLFERQRREMLGIGDSFFGRHGAKAVFIGRWLPVLRVYASWMAGASRMRWRTFAIWNAAGGIAWAASIALFAYFVGASAKSAVERFGVFGVLVVAIGVVAIAVAIRRKRRRFELDPEKIAG